MLGDSPKAACGNVESSVLDKHNMNKSSGTHVQHVIPSTLKRLLGKKYGRGPTKLVVRYFRSMIDLASYATNAAFLMRCRSMRFVPKAYRVDCREIKNTRTVVRIIDECSYRLMVADLNYNRLRKVQVTSLLVRLQEKLEIIMSDQDLSSVMDLSKEKYLNIFRANQERQRIMFVELLKEYHIDHPEDQHNDE